MEVAYALFEIEQEQYPPGVRALVIFPGGGTGPKGAGRVPLKGGGITLPESFPRYSRGVGEWVNVNSIEVYHSPAGAGGSGWDVPGLIESITEHGFDPYEAIPVVITRKGRIIIVGGHHRLEAVKQLGYTYIPAKVVREELNDPASTYFRTLESWADNYKTSLGQ
jgi:hypothetical protein